MSSSRTDSAALVEVTMPQMGVSVAEGTIVNWHKHPGDWVEADETVCEISTDKIDTEIPSPRERPGRARSSWRRTRRWRSGPRWREIDTGSRPARHTRWKPTAASGRRAERRRGPSRTART